MTTFRIRLHHLLVYSTVGWVTLTGCGPAATSANVDATQATEAVPDRPLVDNPEYLHWNGFPVGAKVVRSKEITNAAGQVQVTTTMTVVDKSSEKIVVEQRIAVVRSDAVGEKLKNPPQSLEYFAKFRMPPGLSLEAFTLPSLKAKRTGTEDVALLGKTYEAEIFEWQDNSEAGPMTIKLWRCDEIPGRALREETRIARDGAVSVETVTSLE